ncbi:hypothetical protein C8F01DRAFT_920882, partial [Mycena amicta]
SRNNVMLDVNRASFKLLDELNKVVLRRILGVGHRSGIPQLYSELGVYPLRVRRLELALKYLRYLLQLPETHLARKALDEADLLRCTGHSSWLGDLSFAMRSLPFSIAPLRSLPHLTPAWCDATIDELRRKTKVWIAEEVDSRVSLSLLHGRREPFEDKPAKTIAMCRRHYLHRVPIADHRLALTRLLNGSFRFRGIHRPTTQVARELCLCRKCGLEEERPEHVFMQCLDPGTVAAREELRATLLEQFDLVLPNGPSSLRDTKLLFQSLIFHWDHVVPTARFVHAVCKNWQ